MQFSRLRLRGFKSFSDEVELPIGDGLTGIVGPNGCGKSNVVEAIRWVMGESSAKDLRGSEMDDVLFGGSALRPAFDVAEVALMVADAGHSAAEDTAESNVYGLAEARAQHWGGDLEITRRIERGSGSTYRINKREVRARDVQLIFADAAAGSRSPAIISQGKVTTIIEAKPEDRRRLLEDAAGIGGLHSRRREAELKLNATEANLARVRDRLADLEQDLTGLQRQAREAERYRKLSEEIRHFEQLLLLARVVEAEDGMAGATEARDRGQSTCAELAAELETATAAVASIARELPTVQAEITQLTGRIAGGRERLARLKEVAASHARDKARMEQALTEARSRAKMLAQALDDKSEALPRAQAALAAAEAERAGRVDRQPDLQARLRDLQNSETAIRQDMQAVLTTATTNQARQAEQARRTAEMQDRLREIDAELARALDVDDDALVKVAERQWNEAKSRLADAAEQEASAQRDLDELQNELSERRHALEDLRRTADEATANWQRLDNERLRVEALLAAFAHKQQDLDQRRQHGLSELERLDAAIAQCDPQGVAAALTASTAELDRLQAELVVARSEHERAGEQQAAASAEVDKLRSGRDRQAAECVALRTEAGALEAVQEDSDPSPVLTGLRIEPGYEAALSAALGDDLLSGKSPERPRFWQEIEPGMLPPWPRPLATLDLFVDGEPALALRLAMVAVCDNPEDAQALQASLQPGQRLVTRDGGLWRWDGFVQRPGAGQAADERLRQRRRHAELCALLPKHEARLADLAADLAACEAAATAATLMVEEIRRAIATLDHRLDAAGRECERLREQLADREDRRTRLVAERARNAGELARIDAELRELARPEGIDPAALASEVEAALARKQALAQELASRLGELEQCERLGRQCRERVTAVGNTVRHASQSLTQAETLHERRLGEAEGRRQARERAIEGLERDRSALNEEIATVTAETDGLVGQAEELEDTRQTLAERHAAIEAELERQRRDATDNAGEIGRLGERIAAMSAECTRLTAEIATLTDDNELAARTLAELTRDADALHIAARADAGASGDAETLEHMLASESRELAARQQRAGELEAALAAASERKERAAEAAVQARERLAGAQADLARFTASFEEALAAAERGISEPPARLLANERIRDALEQSSTRQIDGQLEQLKSRRERMGAVNLRAAAEIQEREAVFGQLRHEEGELSEAIQRLTAAIGELDQEARKRLITAFDKVDGHFRRLFVQLFGGGKAHLRLTNIDVPGKAGLELDAMPPGKKLQNISLLSGGEKGLTALALVFALFLSQPSPLCVLDEVDAALDDANVERFVEMMVDIARSTDTRFIVVTHHPLTMARMDRLFGVTMIERGVSRLVSVTLSTAVDMRTTA